MWMLGIWNYQHCCKHTDIIDSRLKYLCWYLYKAHTRWQFHWWIPHMNMLYIYYCIGWDMAPMHHIRIRLMIQAHKFPELNSSSTCGNIGCILCLIGSIDNLQWNTQLYRKYMMRIAHIHWHMMCTWLNCTDHNSNNWRDRNCMWALTNSSNSQTCKFYNPNSMCIQHNLVNSYSNSYHLGSN